MKTTPPDSGKSAAAGDTQQAALDASHDPRNPALVADVAAWMERNQLPNNATTHRKLGQALHYKDGTAVYRYIKGSPEGDLVKFETRLAAFLANELRIEGGATLCDDSGLFVTASMFNFLRQSRELSGISVAHGPAGVGKSCAARLYAAKHPGKVIYTHVWSWTSGKTMLAREICKNAGLKPAKNQTHEALLRKHCQDGAIMLILDNAQRLTFGSRHWLADFLDFTGCPIALIGNPEIVSQWGACDQHKRRCLLKRDISTDLLKKSAQAARTVSYLLEQHLGQAAQDPQVKNAALKLLQEPNSGVCGTIVAHAKLAAMMLKGGTITAPAEAFHLATTQLIAA